MMDEKGFEKIQKLIQLLCCFLWKVWKNEYGNLYILFLRVKNKRTCLNVHLFGA